MAIIKTNKIPTPTNEAGPILIIKIAIAIPIGTGNTIKKVGTQGQNQF